MNGALVSAVVTASYLVGSIPFALVLGLARGVDIRRQGSGNIGATNLGRALGRRWAIGAFALDFAKGLVAVLVAGILFSEADPTRRGLVEIACGAAAVLGHVFPIYLRFRGGKGVATTFGAMAALELVGTLISGVVWLVVYSATRVVSVASIAAGVSLPIAVWLRHLGQPFSEFAGVQVFSIVVAVLILVRHRSNIGRLLRGEELGFSKKRGASSENHIGDAK